MFLPDEIDFEYLSLGPDFPGTQECTNCASCASLKYLTVKMSRSQQGKLRWLGCVERGVAGDCDLWG